MEPGTTPPRQQLVEAVFLALALRIRELDLRGCEQISCRHLCYECEGLSALEVLRLNTEEQGRSLPQAIRLVPSFKGLRVADLAFCPELDDPVVSALAQCCPRLEDVSLRGCAMGNDGVMALIQHCVELRSLDISVWPHERLRNVNTITDVALFFLAQVAALRGDACAFESLSMVGRKGVSDDGVAMLLECVPRLRRIDLRHCINCMCGEPAEPWPTERATGIAVRRGARGQEVDAVRFETDATRTPPGEYEAVGTPEAPPRPSARGLFQLLQSVSAVRAAVELQARAAAEQQAADMLVEAAQVQSRAAEIHAQGMEVQAQAAAIMARVAEVQVQVCAMETEAEAQGNSDARVQAAEMKAQVAAMQVHAAQMMVNAAQMQIRSTEMKAQASEMQVSALNICAQAASLVAPRARADPVSAEEAGAAEAGAAAPAVGGVPREGAHAQVAGGVAAALRPGGQNVGGDGGPASDVLQAHPLGLWALESASRGAPSASPRAALGEGGSAARGGGVGAGSAARAAGDRVGAGGLAEREQGGEEVARDAVGAGRGAAREVPMREEALRDLLSLTAQLQGLSVRVDSLQEREADLRSNQMAPSGAAGTSDATAAVGAEAHEASRERAAAAAATSAAAADEGFGTGSALCAQGQGSRGSKALPAGTAPPAEAALAPAGEPAASGAVQSGVSAPREPTPSGEQTSWSGGRNAVGDAAGGGQIRHSSGAPGPATPSPWAVAAASGAARAVPVEVGQGAAEGLAAVEQRLSVVRDEQRRLTETVQSLRERIERLRDEGTGRAAP